MAEETKTSSWKVWTVGIAIILAGISGCTVKMFTGGNPGDALSEGVSGVTQGVQVIKSGDLPAAKE